MKDREDGTTISFSTPDGKTTGPIPEKEFSRRLKEGLKKMERARVANTNHDDKPDYWRDSALDKLGEDIRLKHHEYLHEAEISFLMTSKAMNRGGKAIIGKARTASGLLKFFSRSDFLIIFNDEAWRSLDLAQRAAAVDHELCHCTYDEDEEGNKTWVLRGHDLEEFTRIVERHGLWKEDLKEFSQAVGRQLELGLNGKAAKEA